MKRWTIIFKALSNGNRLEIINLLYKNKRLSVTELANKLHISIKAVSRHLVMLRDFDVLNSVGEKGNVFYSINQNMSRDFKQTIDLFRS